ncbi:MAG: acetyl-CoA carboxylase biotin carboxyl carrier protein subunit [Ekhidna sp.]
MIEVKVGEEKKISVEKQRNAFLLNGKPSKYNIEKVNERSFKVFSDSKIYDIQVIEQNGKEMSLSINNHVLTVKVSDHIDQILEELGMDALQANVVKEIKAPMPGAILNILTEEGNEVKEGDHLLVLEAMKMENVIKSPGEGKVSKIHVSEKDNVEKNQVLITFE